MSKTWGETANEFLACKTSQEASEWLSKEIERHSKEYNYTLERSEQILRESLGYMMGYYSDEQAARMQKLLDLTHPILPWVGKMPTTETNLKKAFRLGTSLPRGEKEKAE